MMMNIGSGCCTTLIVLLSVPSIASAGKEVCFTYVGDFGCNYLGAAELTSFDCGNEDPYTFCPGDTCTMSGTLGGDMTVPQSFYTQVTMQLHYSWATLMDGYVDDFCGDWLNGAYGCGYYDSVTFSGANYTVPSFGFSGIGNGAYLNFKMDMYDSDDEETRQYLGSCFAMASPAQDSDGNYIWASSAGLVVLVAAAGMLYNKRRRTATIAAESLMEMSEQQEQQQPYVAVA